jgi:tRNA dimethylallyltransferase
MRAPGVIALVGATATGKTALGEALAARLDAEVVCGDSRQVFAELEIATGKPTPAARGVRPHHLYDALRLGAHASAGWFARAAWPVLDTIAARARPALLVGGSGLYLRALERGLAPLPPHDPGVRERLRAELERAGSAALHARLTAVDPAAAARLAPGDRQRVTRALEVFESTGRPLTWWLTQPAPRRGGARWTVLELRVSPAALRPRIAQRTAAMFAGGLVEETRALLDRGIAAPLAALCAIGYDEALGLLAGRWDRAEAERRTSLRTARLAKRQRTWFRHQVEALPLDGEAGEAAQLERALLALAQP